MLKKYRQLVTGIVIGSLLFAMIPAIANTLRTYTAEEAGFPVVVDGNPVELDMPVVTIEDRTYLPLRAMGDALGVKVTWNEELQRAEVYQNGGYDTLDKTSDGLSIFRSDDGGDYVDFSYVIFKYQPEDIRKVGAFYFNIVGDDIQHGQILQTTKTEPWEADVILDNIPLFRANKNLTGVFYVPLDYYENTVWPCLKELLAGQK